jgi:hypothetical protein
MFISHRQHAVHVNMQDAATASSTDKQANTSQLLLQAARTIRMMQSDLLTFDRSELCFETFVE